MKESNILETSQYINYMSTKNNFINDCKPRELDICGDGDRSPLIVFEGSDNFLANICFENVDKTTVVTAYYKVKSKFEHQKYYE